MSFEIPQQQTTSSVAAAVENHNNNNKLAMTFSVLAIRLYFPDEGVLDDIIRQEYGVAVDKMERQDHTDGVCVYRHMIYPCCRAAEVNIDPERGGATATVRWTSRRDISNNTQTFSVDTPTTSTTFQITVSGFDTVKQSFQDLAQTTWTVSPSTEFKGYMRLSENCEVEVAVMGKGTTTSSTKVGLTPETSELDTSNSHVFSSGCSSPNLFNQRIPSDKSLGHVPVMKSFDRLKEWALLDREVKVRDPLSQSPPRAQNSKKAQKRSQPSTARPSTMVRSKSLEILPQTPHVSSYARNYNNNNNNNNNNDQSLYSKQSTKVEPPLPRVASLSSSKTSSLRVVDMLAYLSPPKEQSVQEIMKMWKMGASPIGTPPRNSKCMTKVTPHSEKRFGSNHRMSSRPSVTTEESLKKCATTPSALELSPTSPYPLFNASPSGAPLMDKEKSESPIMSQWRTLALFSHREPSSNSFESQKVTRANALKAQRYRIRDSS